MDVVTDPRCLLHDVPLGFPEQPSRLISILAGLRAGGRAVHEPGAHPDARPLVERVHSAAYVERFRAAVERGDGLFDSADNPLVASTWDAACGAVDATLHAADAALAGRAAFAAVLEVFARSGRAWIVATVRSDFFAACQAIEPLRRLRAGRGQIDLLPP
ncbi:MAG TPA: hypothetical protein VN811_06985, partial [Thermoanaerobaculia bacterium]|nr:hypothetical protein [Thermoanaerobaculia bacterium]